jgi:hypothetical protein
MNEEADEEVTIHEILAVLALSMVSAVAMGMFYAGLVLLFLAFLKRTFRFQYYGEESKRPIRRRKPINNHQINDKPLDHELRFVVLCCVCCVARMLISLHLVHKQSRKRTRRCLRPNNNFLVYFLYLYSN